MWTYNNSNELYHFGMKGMKWGVRKQKRADSKASKKLAGMIRNVKTAADDYARSVRVKTIRVTPDGPAREIEIYNKNKQVRVYRLADKVNRYMDKLEKKIWNGLGPW